MEAPPAEVEPTDHDRDGSGRSDGWLAGAGDGTDPDRHVHVVLLGLPGAGTSTVGRLLAHELHRPYVDHDSIVDLEHDRPNETGDETGAGTGAGGADRDPRGGDPDLDALRRVLATHGSVVYGAGCHVARSARPEDLADAYVVWLDASPEVVADRIGRRDHPALGPEPLQALREMVATLGRKTRDMCDLEVSVDDARPDEAADQIRRAWRSHVDELVSRDRQGRVP